MYVFYIIYIYVYICNNNNQRKKSIIVRVGGPWVRLEEEYLGGAGGRKLKDESYIILFQLKTYKMIYFCHFSLQISYFTFEIVL